MATWGLVLHILLTCVLAVMLQWEKVKNTAMAEAVVSAHEWIDEILEALRNPDETAGDRTIHGLVAKRSNDEWPVPPVD